MSPLLHSKIQCTSLIATVLITSFLHSYAFSSFPSLHALRQSKQSFSCSPLIKSICVLGGLKHLRQQRQLHFRPLHAITNSFDGILDVKRTYTMSNNSGDGDANEEEAMTTTTGEEVTSSHEIRYHIHNRMNLSSQQAAPILVLHGGPGVPSDYLHPLQEVIPYRSIIFYDQLGCGRSMEGSPLTKDAYSIESSLDDLEALIAKIGLRKFHLYGQSYGGILAYEYVKRMVQRNSDRDGDGNEDLPHCLSLILSSTPSNVKHVEGVANDLITNLLAQDADETTIMERFRINHQCRTEEKPQPLIDAYEHAGEQGIWRGTQSIQGWEASNAAMLPASAKRMPSVMIMRGEYDFVTEECILGWKEAFNHPFVRIKVLEGCSHHGLLENGHLYGETVDSFFAEYD